MEKDFSRVVTLPFETKAYEEDGDMFVEGIITTQDVDRTGEVMDMKGLKNWATYKKNPITFWWHSAPIGHAVEMERRDDSIWVKDQLAPTKVVLETVWPLLKNKSIRTMSIGFNPTEDPGGEEIDGVWHWTAWELLEHSLVPVPANPKTSARIAKSLGLEMGGVPLAVEETSEEDMEDEVDEGTKRQREVEMCRERIDRIGGGVQGVSDIAAHWQRAGASFIEVVGQEYLDKLTGASKRLDEILHAEEPGSEPGQGKSAIEVNVEAALGEIFPLADTERLYEVYMTRRG